MTRLCMSLLLILAVVPSVFGQEPNDPTSTPAQVAESAGVTTVTASPTRLVDHPILRACWLKNCELRASRGLRPHALNERLCAAAQDHANWMAANHSMQHYSNAGPFGRAVRYGFRRGVQENIAYGYGSVDSAFSAWVNSGGHYANMMSGTSSAGFGCAVSSNGTLYWCAVYGNSGDGVDGDVTIEGDAPTPTKAVELPAVQGPPLELPTVTVSYSNYGTSGRRGFFGRWRR
jgi:hypothetical protein